jgi:hypothetical protein
VPQTIAIKDWGELTVFGLGEREPDELRAVDYLWRSGSRKRACELRTRTRQTSVAYVAVWPSDGPEPPESLGGIADLGGVVLTEPVLALHCFACGAEFAGLLPSHWPSILQRSSRAASTGAEVTDLRSRLWCVSSDCDRAIST